MERIEWTEWVDCPITYYNDDRKALVNSSVKSVRIRKICSDEYELQTTDAPGAYCDFYLKDGCFYIGSDDAQEFMKLFNEWCMDLMYFNQDIMENTFNWANAIWNG